MKSLTDLKKMSLADLFKLLPKAKESLVKIKLSATSNKEADTSKVWKNKKYVARISTVINQIKNK